MGRLYFEHGRTHTKILQKPLNLPQPWAMEACSSAPRPIHIDLSFLCLLYINKYCIFARAQKQLNYEGCRSAGIIFVITMRLEMRFYVRARRRFVFLSDFANASWFCPLTGGRFIANSSIC
jgi:hypothetical protein